MFDIVIIGAGPAGLTSAIYAARSGKKVLVLEKLSYGGQIVNSPKIDNYPGMPHTSGFDFSTTLYNQAIEFGAIFQFDEVIQIQDFSNYKVVITNEKKFETKSIILAMGLERRKLGISRESEFIGKGISYCATCDGMFYKDKDVAIVGGGNTALDDALYLSELCHQVILIHRRDKFRGENSTVQKIFEKDNIHCILSAQITELIGDDKLQSIKVSTVDGKKIIPVSCLFVAIGGVPNTNFLENISLKNGYILSSDECMTNIPGIFVAGDVRLKDIRQLVTATSDGAISAVRAIQYLNHSEN